MGDHILAFIVVIAPTLFAIGIEVVDKQIHEHRYWRFGIIGFGLILSGLTWLQLSRESASRENAIRETSKAVAAETSEQVTRTVTELYSKMISDQKDQIASLQNQLAAQSKDVSAIKSSNIVSGKNPIKVEVTNPGSSGTAAQPHPILSGIRIASQKQTASDNANFPYALEVVLQTDVDISPVKLALLCDGPIGEGSAGLSGGGAYTMVFQGLAQGNDHVFIAKWDSPAWTPDKPVVVRLFSKGPIRVVGLSRNVL